MIYDDIVKEGENHKKQLREVLKTSLDLMFSQVAPVIQFRHWLIQACEGKLKDYRSTFYKLAIDLGADLQTVSKVMGHKTTVTTETYYSRIRDDTAISEIERAFSEPGAQALILPKLKINQIEK